MEYSVLLAILIVVVLIAVAVIADARGRETMSNAVRMNVATPRAPCDAPPVVDYGRTGPGATVQTHASWDNRSARSVSSMINSIDLVA
jgi:hypothetical protein